MSAENNINKLNIKIPKAAEPVGSYAAAKIVNNLLYISG